MLSTRPNVLLVVLDCLRRDYWKRKMPLTRKAVKRAGFFSLDNHWGVAHCSDPNHAALFAGFGPWQTNITTQMGVDYKEKLPTLFWRWKREVGGTTWAVEPVMVPEFYRNHVDLLAHHKGTDSSDPDLAAIRQFVAEVEPGKPWLGFIRSMTCHYPYLDLPSPPRGTAQVKDQYLEAVAHEDQFLNNLTEFVLTEHPETIIIYTSDHGELLGEHGEWDHLYTLYSILTWVPMVLYVPGLKTKKTKRPTQHIDLTPTLCDLLGLDRQGEGVSWAEWILDETVHPSPADRLMWFQGTGAGPAWSDIPSDNLDPGYARVLWRHRGLVKGAYKLVDDVHAQGVVNSRATNAKDYRERKTNRRAENLRQHLPPVPDYHPWERAVIWGAKEKSDDEIILKRLRALGYA
jgi:arylsulfatase A-like enzyme